TLGSTSVCTLERCPTTLKHLPLCRKALLVGINYRNSIFPLRGCISDVEAIRTLLISRFKFPASKICVLTDQNDELGFLPTKKNILEKMQWLVDQAMPGDSLFLHFSGHGYQVKDISGDELDGYDEAILPCDFETEGYILDDVLYDILVRPLKEGVRLTVVFDSCHSGTAYISQQRT
ncbi:Ca(2+)-dependent cysteine protease, partial [Coelomomyces lativittatus]